MTASPAGPSAPVTSGTGGRRDRTARPYPGGVGKPEQHPRLSDRARRAIAGTSPPTLQIGLRASDSEIDELAAHSALELALRLGESMLAVGVGAGDVTATMLRVAAAYRLTSCQVDVTYTSLTVSWNRPGGVPLTGMRIVRARTTDYTRLHAVTALARDINDGLVDVEEAHRRLDRIVSRPHPYRRAVVTLALAGMAAAVGFLLGGGWRVAVVAALTTAVIDRMMRSLNRWRLPYFFQQAAGGALVTIVAVMLVVLGTGVRTSLVVGAGLVVLLAGLSLVGAAEDAISGFHLTAAARAFEVMTLTGGIVVGIAAVLDLARRFEVPLAVADPVALAVPLPVQLAAAVAVASCFAASSYAGFRHAVVAGLAGGLSLAAFWLARDLGTGPAAASAAAAAVVGFCGEGLTERLRLPPLLIAVSGIIPLLPGLTIYRGLFALILESDVAAGLGHLTTAVMIGMALAAGVTLGEFLASRVREQDRWDRTVRRRAMSGRD